MGCDAEFCTAIIIAAVTTDRCYKFDLFCLGRYSECIGAVLFVVVFVEFSALE